MKAIRKSTKIWQTKDGRKVRICDMTNSHLLNTIKYLEKQTQYAKAELSYPSFQGDMAQMCAENEWYAFQEAGPDDVYPIYDDMVQEALRRKLQLP